MERPRMRVTSAVLGAGDPRALATFYEVPRLDAAGQRAGEARFSRGGRLGDAPPTPWHYRTAGAVLPVRAGLRATGLASRRRRAGDDAAPRHRGRGSRRRCGVGAG